MLIDALPVDATTPSTNSSDDYVNSTSTVPLTNTRPVVATVFMPENAVDDSVYLQAERLLTAPSQNSSLVAPETTEPLNNFRYGNYSFSVTASDTNRTHLPGFRFKQPMTVRVYYDVTMLWEDGGDLIATVQPLPLLAFWDTTATPPKWISARETCTPPRDFVDVVHQVYEVDICHLTQFALFFQYHPIAVASATLSGYIISLNGSASIDTQGTIALYRWEVRFLLFEPFECSAVH
jgi:hypothetical protein